MQSYAPVTTLSWFGITNSYIKLKKTDEFQDLVDLVDGDKPAEGDSTDDQGSHEWMFTRSDR